MSTPAPDPREQQRRALRRRVVPAAVGIGVVGVVAAGIVAVTGAIDDTPEPPALPPLAYTAEPTPPPGPNLVDELGEELLYAPIDAATSEWLDALQLAVMADPNFGTVAISPDRTTVTITWYGAPSRTLTEQIAAAPEAISVVVQEAAFQPGELQALVGQAMQPDLLPGIRVSMGAVENDGSGIRIGIWELPDGSSQEDVAEQIAAAIGRPDVPVTVEVAQVVPAT